MTFRTKLLLLSSITTAGAVALVTGAVSVASREAFEQTDGRRRQDLLSQLDQELAARGLDVVRQMERAAVSPVVQRITTGNAEYDEAQRAAAAEGLDFLDVVRQDFTIISSAHWPARFGYKNDWRLDPKDWNQSDTEASHGFLSHVPIPDGSAIAAIIAVRRVRESEAYVVGGRRVTSGFLKSLGQAPGLHTLLWLPPGEVIDANGSSPDITRLAAILGEARGSRKQVNGTVRWSTERSSTEAFLALPLERRGQLAGVLLAGTSLAAQFALENEILWIGISVAAAGIVIGILLGWWTTERVTRPVALLAAGTRVVASGDWSARVDVMSSDEIGELAFAFNRMTEQLVEQRERAIQAERVAAWRELARRLAHELKNPLFPLQITIENLRKASRLPPAEFAEVFEESTRTLLAELGNLKTIVGRFSDFAKMPPPRFESVDVNELLRGALKLYEPQFAANGRPPVHSVTELFPGSLTIQADGEQLRRAIGNLVVNAIDAMPNGGVLRLASSQLGGRVRFAISDTGQGLTEEECARLFTPYYTTKQHGTGLGLAIVQSVISDHRGTISVESKPGQGATFLIELPESQGAPFESSVDH